MIEQIDLMSYVLPTFKFPKGHKIKLFEAFSGIGCQRLGLKRLTDNYESVGISEIDKAALKSYEAIHGDCKNFGSICDIHELPEIDIFTWSFPCTDLSKAGKQKGLGSKEKGQEQTRSGLCYEVLRVLHENKHNLPRILIMENVIDLIQVKFISQFNEIQREIESLGYKNYTFVMNGKNYGIPQNRERVFMVSILSDYQEYYYEQPKPFPLKLRLKDMLEDNVDEKYYLSKKMLQGMMNTKFESYKLENKLRERESIASTIIARIEGCPQLVEDIPDIDGGGLLMKNNTKQGYLIAQEGDGIDVSGRMKYHRGTVQKGIAQTLKTGSDVGVCVNDLDLKKDTENYVEWHEDGKFDSDCRAWKIDKVSPTTTTTTKPPKIINSNLRIRKLTPKECWRLMGIDDEDFEKAAKVTSNAQLYKQAGNGIIVDCFYYILKGLIDDGTD